MSKVLLEIVSGDVFFFSVWGSMTPLFFTNMTQCSATIYAINLEPTLVSSVAHTTFTSMFLIFILLSGTEG